MRTGGGVSAANGCANGWRSHVGNGLAISKKIASEHEALLCGRYSSKEGPNGNKKNQKLGMGLARFESKRTH